MSTVNVVTYNEHLKNGWKKDDSKKIGQNGEIHMKRDSSHQSEKIFFQKDLTGN